MCAQATAAHESSLDLKLVDASLTTRAHAVILCLAFKGCTHKAEDKNKMGGAQRREGNRSQQEHTRSACIENGWGEGWQTSGVVPPADKTSGSADSSGGRRLHGQLPARPARDTDVGGIDCDN